MAENNPPIQDWVKLMESDYAKVIFKDVKKQYSQAEDISCTFEISEGVQPTDADYIGLFTVGFSNLNQCIVSKNVGKESKQTVHFLASELPQKTNDFLQFLYIGEEGVIHGASTPFLLQAAAEEGAVDDGFLIINPPAEKTVFSPETYKPYILRSNPPCSAETGRASTLFQVCKDAIQKGIKERIDAGVNIQSVIEEIPEVYWDNPAKPMTGKKLKPYVCGLADGYAYQKHRLERCERELRKKEKSTEHTAEVRLCLVKEQNMLLREKCAYADQAVRFITNAVIEYVANDQKIQSELTGATNSNANTAKAAASASNAPKESTHCPQITAYTICPQCTRQQPCEGNATVPPPFVRAAVLCRECDTELRAMIEAMEDSKKLCMEELKRQEKAYKDLKEKYLDVVTKNADTARHERELQLQLESERHKTFRTASHYGTADKRCRELENYAVSIVTENEDLRTRFSSLYTAYEKMQHGTGAKDGQPDVRQDARTERLNSKCQKLVEEQLVRANAENLELKMKLMVYESKQLEKGNSDVQMRRAEPQEAGSVCGDDCSCVKWKQTASRLREDVTYYTSRLQVADHEKDDLEKSLADSRETASTLFKFMKRKLDECEAKLKKANKNNAAAHDAIVMEVEAIKEKTVAEDEKDLSTEKMVKEGKKKRKTSLLDDNEELKRQVAKMGTALNAVSKSSMSMAHENFNLKLEVQELKEKAADVQQMQDRLREAAKLYKDQYLTIHHLKKLVKKYEDTRNRPCRTEAQEPVINPHHPSVRYHYVSGSFLDDKKTKNDIPKGDLSEELLAMAGQTSDSDTGELVPGGSESAAAKVAAPETSGAGTACAKISPIKKPALPVPMDRSPPVDPDDQWPKVEMLVCPTCPEMFPIIGNDNTLLLNHLRSDHNQLLCPVCGMMFDVTLPPKYMKCHVEAHFNDN